MCSILTLCCAFLNKHNSSIRSNKFPAVMVLQLYKYDKKSSLGFLILSSLVRHSLRLNICHLGLPTEILCAFLMSYMHAVCTADLNLFDS
jgi:hypothetical protein